MVAVLHEHRHFVLVFHMAAVIDRRHRILLNPRRRAADKIPQIEYFAIFLLPWYMAYTYITGHEFKPTPQSLLNDIAQIQRLDRGTVSVLRQGPQGPYYNHPML